MGCFPLLPVGKRKKGERKAIISLQHYLSVDGNIRADDILYFYLLTSCQEREEVTTFFLCAPVRQTDILAGADPSIPLFLFYLLPLLLKPDPSLSLIRITPHNSAAGFWIYFLGDSGVSPLARHEIIRNNKSCFIARRDTPLKGLARSRFDTIAASNYGNGRTLKPLRPPFFHPFYKSSLVARAQQYIFCFLYSVNLLESFSSS